MWTWKEKITWKAYIAEKYIVITQNLRLTQHALNSRVTSIWAFREKWIMLTNCSKFAASKKVE